jgi:uncharacterized membrane protein YdjX (TVP38/TMEM64 family)
MAVLALLALVVIPFLLVGESLEDWSVAALRESATGRAAAWIGGALLVADVFLPVPSSFILAALGTTLGAAAGTLVGALGMSLGCVLAYGLGSALGPSRAERLVTREEQARLARGFARHGWLALAACRPVPVLAEASVLAAGILRLPKGPALLTTSAANLGVAGCYAALGASAGDGAALAAALAASMILPGAALALAGLLRRRSAAAPPEALRPEDRYAG